MKWELSVLWKVFTWACIAFRWLTRQKPRRGVCLIVEDNPDDADTIQRRLHKLGWESEIAKTGEVAEGLVKHQFYPICFVDMRLPGMPGEAVVRLLSKNTPNTNIVIVCGEPNDLMRLSDEQSVVFMRKPPSLEALADLFRKLKLL